MKDLPLPPGALERWTPAMLRALVNRPEGLRIGPQGHRFLLWDRMDGAYYWDTELGVGGPFTAHRFLDARFLDDDRVVFLGSRVRVVDAATMEVLSVAKVADVKQLALDHLAPRFGVVSQADSQTTVKIYGFDGALLWEVTSLPPRASELWVGGDVAVIQYRGALVVVDVASGDEILKISTSDSPGIALSPDGVRLAVLGLEGEGQYGARTLRVFDLRTRVLLAQISDQQGTPVFGPEYSMALGFPIAIMNAEFEYVETFDVNVYVVAWGAGAWWALIDRTVRRLGTQSSSPTGAVRAIQATESGARVSFWSRWWQYDPSGWNSLDSGAPSPDGSIRAVRDGLVSAGGNLLAHVDGLSSFDACWSPSGRRIAALADKQLVVWDTEGHVTNTAPCPPPRTKIAWIGDECIVMFSDFKVPTAILIALDRGQSVTLGPKLPGAHAVVDLDGDALVLHSDKVARRWSVQDGALKEQFPMPEWARGASARRGRLVVFGSGRVAVRERDGTWRQTADARDVSQAALLDDGSLLTGGLHGVVTRWDVSALLRWSHQPAKFDLPIPMVENRPIGVMLEIPGRVSVFLDCHMHSLPDRIPDDDFVDAAGSGHPQGILGLLSGLSCANSFVWSCVAAAEAIGRPTATHAIALYGVHYNAEPGPVGEGFFLGCFPYFAD